MVVLHDIVLAEAPFAAASFNVARDFPTAVEIAFICLNFGLRRGHPTTHRLGGAATAAYSGIAREEFRQASQFRLRNFLDASCQCARRQL